jgi:hypothetical protein
VADPDALIGQTVSHYRISALASRPVLFENSLLGFLSKTSGERRKLNVAVDWTCDIFFKPNLVELRVAQQQRFKQAHYAAVDFVFRKGEAGGAFFVVKGGSAGPPSQTQRAAPF